MAARIAAEEEGWNNNLTADFMALPGGQTI